MEQIEQIEKLVILNEPTLQFAEAQDAVDPHDGLTLFGPHSLGQPSHPQSPTYIVIGAQEGVERFKRWSVLMNKAAFRSRRPVPPETAIRLVSLG